MPRLVVTCRDIVTLLVLTCFLYGQLGQRSHVVTLNSSSLAAHQPTTDASTATIIHPASPLRFEIVVTLLYNHSQSSWKTSKTTAAAEDGRFLLSPLLQDIPVTICSPDPLISPAVHVVRRELPYFAPETVYDHLQKNRTGLVSFLPMVNGKRAGEVPGYLTYILHYYDVLPDVVIFLHSNPTAHGPNILQNIRHVVDGHWALSQIGFLHLNEGNVLCRSGGRRGSWGTFWQMLGFNRSHMPNLVKLPCCAQFMVTRERIWLRPKWFYQQLLKLTYNLEMGAFQEHYWHVFFGESAILSDDREIQHYYNNAHNWTKIKKPVQDAVLFHPYPNVPFSESMKPWYEESIRDPDSYYPHISSNPKEQCPPGSIYD